MKEFSAPMALVDYIPVVLFTLAASILSKDLKKKMSYAMLMELDLIGMLVRSISPEAASAAEAPGN